MRNLLFLHIRTTTLDTGQSRIAQLSTRLVSKTYSQDFNQLVSADPNASNLPPGAKNQVATQHETSLATALDHLLQQIEEADIIIGHDINHTIDIIVKGARRTGNHHLETIITHPEFGLKAGQRAAICTRELTADYLRFLGDSSSYSDNSLATVYRSLFQEELASAHDTMVSVVASQRLYNFLCDFQLEKDVEFPAGIVLLED